VEREACALEAASRAGAPVPAVFERVTVDGRPGMVMERLDGESLLAWLGRRPWRVLAAGSLLGREHAALHRVTAPAALPALREELRRRPVCAAARLAEGIEEERDAVLAVARR
jgi:hypothetical protein